MIEYIYFMIVVVANWRRDNGKSHIPYVRTYIPQVRRVLIFFFDMLYVPGMYERESTACTAAAPQKQ